jgi:hypothetical protein
MAMMAKVRALKNICKAPLLGPTSALALSSNCSAVFVANWSRSATSWRLSSAKRALVSARSFWAVRRLRSASATWGREGKWCVGLGGGVLRYVAAVLEVGWGAWVAS